MLHEEGLEQRLRAPRPPRRGDAARGAGVGARDPVRGSRSTIRRSLTARDDAGGPQRRRRCARSTLEAFDMSLGTGLGQARRQGVPHRPPRRLQRPDHRRHAGRRRDGLCAAGVPHKTGGVQAAMDYFTERAKHLKRASHPLRPASPSCEPPALRGGAAGGGTPRAPCIATTALAPPIARRDLRGASTMATAALQPEQDSNERHPQRRNPLRGAGHHRHRHLQPAARAQRADLRACTTGWARSAPRVPADRSVRAIIVTGAGGRAFGAGTDISLFRDFKPGPADGLAYEARMEAMFAKLERCPVPTIAAIPGICTGGAAVIAAACDLRIATRNLKFGFPIARTLANCSVGRQHRPRRHADGRRPRRRHADDHAADRAPTRRWPSVSSTSCSTRPRR